LEGLSVLDIGCGGGLVSEPLARLGATVTGLDPARENIEAARRHFPSFWFNEATTTAGLEALGFYHEKKDDKRDIGLGPEHDWSSHSADAFGLACVSAEKIWGERKPDTKSFYGAFRRAG
jgi:phage terminase large subunit